LHQDKLTRALLTLGLGFKPQLSGRDNALLGCMLQGASRREARAMLHTIQEFSELEEFFDQPVKTYSSGMRARLGFATAMTIEVDLLLIDETLSVGDASFNEKAEKAMMQKIERDQTVIFVSHNSQQVQRLCKRAIWLEAGEVREHGLANDIAVAYQQFMKDLRANRSVTR
jgi:lipopolysaccharide transport system ATP-binding protein